MGSLLFLLYVNDLHHASKVLNQIMFADDTNLFFSHSNINRALFQNLLANGDKIKVHCFTILGDIGHTTYFHVNEKVDSLMCMIRKLHSEVHKTDQIKFFVCWMENSASS